MRRQTFLLAIPIAIIVLVPLQHYISLKNEPLPPQLGGITLSTQYPNGTERWYRYEGSTVLSSVLVDAANHKTLSESFYALRLVDGEYRLVVAGRKDYTLWGRSRWYVLGAAVLCLIAALLGFNNEQHFWKIPTFGAVAAVLLGFGAGWILEPGQPGASSAETGGALVNPASGFPRPPGDPQSMARVERLEALLGRDPTNYDNLVDMGNLQYDLGKLVEARGYYERARAIRDDSPGLLTDLGSCYVTADPRRAVELFDRAATLSPYHWQSRYNAMVVLYNDLKDLVGARGSACQASSPAVASVPRGGAGDWEQRLAGSDG